MNLELDAMLKELSIDFDWSNPFLDDVCHRYINGVLTSDFISLEDTLDRIALIDPILEKAYELGLLDHMLPARLDTLEDIDFGYSGPPLTDEERREGEANIAEMQNAILASRLYEINNPLSKDSINL